MPRYSRHRQQRKRPIADINVVPYIDVMLVLLVIFMITAPLLTQGIHVNLPQTSSKALDTKAPMPIIVSVDQAGRYFLNTSKTPEQPINAQTLMSTVNQTLTTASQHQQAQPVYVKGDKAAHYGQVVAAMVLLQKAGAKEVGLITQDPESA